MTEILEVQEKVEAYEWALQQNISEVLDHYERVETKFGAAGQKKLGLAAWPLRPLFLDLGLLQTISRRISDYLELFREKLLAQVDDIGQLARELRLDRETIEALGLATSLRDRDLLSAARPDGFLYSDRYVVSEFNVGGGLFATLSYTEVLHDLLLTGPVAESLSWLHSEPRRPFHSYLKILRERIGAVDDPTIALLIPHQEKDQLHHWELDLFGLLWQSQGIRALVLDERELRTDAQGVLRETGQDRRIHAAIALSTGECYLSDPDDLSQVCSKLNPEKPFHAFLHPLACLCFGKGCLPWLAKNAPVDANLEEFSVELAPSHWPDPSRADEYRLQKSNWVIKRAWTGKNTFVGRSSHGRVWNRAVETALKESGSIVQEYSSLPTILLPYLIDGKIEKIPVRFELSPFLIDRRYAGALVRYAPDGEGIVLSPSPTDLGITIVASGPQ